jgi:hypothetical protein
MLHAPVDIGRRLADYNRRDSLEKHSCKDVIPRAQHAHLDGML